MNELPASRIPAATYYLLLCPQLLLTHLGHGLHLNPQRLQSSFRADSSVEQSRGVRQRLLQLGCALGQVGLPVPGQHEQDTSATVALRVYIVGHTLPNTPQLGLGSLQL